MPEGERRHAQVEDGVTMHRPMSAEAAEAMQGCKVSLMPSRSTASDYGVRSSTTRTEYS